MGIAFTVGMGRQILIIVDALYQIIISNYSVTMLTAEKFVSSSVHLSTVKKKPPKYILIYIPRKKRISYYRLITNPKIGMRAEIRAE